MGGTSQHRGCGLCRMASLLCRVWSGAGEHLQAREAPVHVYVLDHAAVAPWPCLQHQPPRLAALECRPLCGRRGLQGVGEGGPESLDTGGEGSLRSDPTSLVSTSPR